MLKLPKLSRTVAAAAAIAILSTAVVSADMKSLIEAAGVTADVQTDLAVFSREGPCYDSDSQSRFHAASISKLFTATVILQLRDEGRLSLRDLVSKHVPEFAGSPILIEHLLTHTSGLRDRERANARTTRAQWDAHIQQLAKQRLASAPGKEWAYADTGFNLLGRVIENIAAKDYSTVMRERLLEPLKMTSSTFDLSQVPEAQRLRATDKRGRALEHPWDVAFLASSGLQSDASELALFGREILAIEAGRQPHGVLRAETLREMTVARVPTEWPGISQGYGWQLQGSGSGVSWRHAGGEAGFESLLSLYPSEGFGLVVMGNRKDWPRFGLATVLADEVRGGRLCAD